MTWRVRRRGRSGATAHRRAGSGTAHVRRAARRGRRAGDGRHPRRTAPRGAAPDGTDRAPRGAGRSARRPRRSSPCADAARLRDGDARAARRASATVRHVAGGAPTRPGGGITRRRPFADARRPFTDAPPATRQPARRGCRSRSGAVRASWRAAPARASAARRWSGTVHTTRHRATGARDASSRDRCADGVRRRARRARAPHGACG